MPYKTYLRHSFDKYLNPLKTTSCFLLIILTSGKVYSQHQFDVISHWLQYRNASNALYSDLADQAYKQLEQRDSIISGLKTLSDWKQRQKSVKETLRRIIGPFPEKTPLNARITKTIKRGSYTIEDIIYESQPHFYVTSSLFIPNGLKGRAPAILYCSGHTMESYRDSAYQQVIINLVKKGFIVFAIDPVGQGERLQYYNPQTRQSTLGQASSQHSYFGMQAFITGSSLARYMIWDGIRAVDYLLTRKEVDPSRIGITGQSGGGTQCAYIAALDDRIYASAPSNYITSFKRLIQAIGPQDAEQNLYHEIAKGIDQADLLEVRAPRPALMITTTRDFFPIQGSIETAEEVSGLYKAYDKSTHFRMVEDDAPHQWTKKNREAMYAFFQKYLDNPGDSGDLVVTPLPEEDLQVSKTGQVATSLHDAATLFDLNLQDATKYVNELQNSRKDLSQHLPKALRSAKDLSGYHEPSVYHQPVFTGRYHEEGYAIDQYFVKGEGNYVIPYLLIIPDKPNGKAVICLNPKGKSTELNNGDIDWFVHRGFTVLAPDLIGMGELGPGFVNLRQATLNWFLSMLTGRSIVAIRAGEVERLVHLLEKGDNIRAVYGLARGTMCATMLYVAAFDKDVQRVCLIHPLSSYRSLVISRSYDPHFIYNAVAGSLQYYDLADLAASLAPRKLMMIDRIDGQHKPIDEKNDRKDISVIRSSYHEQKADGQLSIIYEKVKDPSDLFSHWAD